VIQAFLFDFDGVLVNSLTYHIQAWQEEFSKLGIQIDPNDVYLREGSRASAIGRALFEKADIRISEMDLEKFIAKKRKRYAEITQAGLMPGARELLLELKRRGLKIGLVTGSVWENILAVLDRQVVAWFNGVVTGRDVVHGKPHPEPYLKGAEKVGVPPETCVVVENAPFGITAAKKAGMFCVAVESTLDADYLREADLIFPGLPDVLNNLDKILHLAETGNEILVKNNAYKI